MQYFGEKSLSPSSNLVLVSFLRCWHSYLSAVYVQAPPPPPSPHTMATTLAGQGGEEKLHFFSFPFFFFPCFYLFIYFVRVCVGTNPPKCWLCATLPWNSGTYRCSQENSFRYEMHYIQATVGIGNVAQLAADVIIETLALNRIGSLEHKRVLPCIGYMPYSHKHSPSGNATAIDIHGSGTNIRVFFPLFSLKHT